jgi:hypothetical protein
MAHQSHTAQPAWADKEVGPVGPEAVVHTAKLVQEFLAKKRIKLLSHLPPYSSDLAQADYFLFPKLKKELAGITMTQEKVKKEWEGVLRGISREEFAKAFVR